MSYLAPVPSLTSRAFPLKGLVANNDSHRRRVLHKVYAREHGTILGAVLFSLRSNPLTVTDTVTFTLAPTLTQAGTPLHSPALTRSKHVRMLARMALVKGGRHSFWGTSSLTPLTCRAPSHVAYPPRQPKRMKPT